MFLNRYRRSVRCPGALGAGVESGAAGSSFACGMGDCLYLDLPRGFFAVADGSDRNTSASREFMEMFSRMLEDKMSLSARQVYDDRKINILKEQLIIEAEKLLVEFSFRDSCTFTGVLLLKTTEKIIAVVFHTGDSLLISCNLRAKTAVQFTSSNFWMVGRSQHFFQIADIYFDYDSRFLLSSDGIRDIPAAPWKSQEELVLDLFGTFSPDDVADRLLEMRGDNSPGYDDLAIIAIDPFRLPDCTGRFIIGGTSANEEKDYQDKKSQGLYRDHYILRSIEEDYNNVVTVM